jgi:hypothetical protein
MRAILIIACTCAWLHTGDPTWLLAWGAVLIRTSPARSGQAERKPETDTAPGKIPPPVGMQRYGEPPAIPPNPLPPVPDANLGREHWWNKPVAGGRK